MTEPDTTEYHPFIGSEDEDEEFHAEAGDTIVTPQLSPVPALRHLDLLSNCRFVEIHPPNLWDNDALESV